jgi:hypothetical protein
MNLYDNLDSLNEFIPYPLDKKFMSSLPKWKDHFQNFTSKKIKNGNKS